MSVDDENIKLIRAVGTPSPTTNIPRSITFLVLKENSVLDSGCENKVNMSRESVELMLIEYKNRY